jgi:hypothetical protein
MVSSYAYIYSNPMCDFLGGNEVVKIEWRTTER